MVVLLKSAMKGFFSDDDVLFINADGILTPKHIEEKKFLLTKWESLTKVLKITQSIYYGEFIPMKRF